MLRSLRRTYEIMLTTPRQRHGLALGLGRKLTITTLAACTLIFGSAAQAGPITFVFDYSQNATDVGFLDPTTGAARQAALTTAGMLYSDLFGQHFTESATIVLEATSTDDALSSTLASAGSFYESNGTGGMVTEVVKTKLQTGVDVNGTDADGTVDVNWGADWQLDPNTPAGPAEFDLFAALFHEFTHALGFSNAMSNDGSPIFGFQDDGSGEWSMYDLFVLDDNGNPVVDQGTWILNQGAFDIALIGDTCGSGLLFGGANATAANGGSAPCLYSPNPPEDGSSIAHLDETEFSTSMMKPFRDFGAGEARTWNGVEIGVLTDIGYTPVSVTAVPEPSTFLLFGAGLSMVYFRRRKKA